MVCIKTCAAEPQSQAQDGGEVVVKLGTVVRKDWVNWCPGKEGKQTHWSEFLETCRWRKPERGSAGGCSELPEGGGGAI